MDAVGNMKVLFSLHDFPLEFKISKAQVDAYATVLRSAESLPPPAPPTLLKDSVSQSTLAVDLSVNGVLPFPVGIVQVIECQYHRVTDEEEVWLVSCYCLSLMFVCMLLSINLTI